MDTSSSASPVSSSQSQATTTSWSQKHPLPSKDSTMKHHSIWNWKKFIEDLQVKIPHFSLLSFSEGATTVSTTGSQLLISTKGNLHRQGQQGRVKLTQDPK
ncbi:hypothetical protein M8J77_003921 [Diaphorina citri]|nr:hypothetical protein M8J77_003921 [Diaphorina citri]